MFLKQHFYHQHIRKAIIAFGTIFNQITINRLNSSSKIVQSLRVPLAYAPKDKFLTRVQAVPGGDDGVQPATVATILPRMGFEIVGLSHDPSRKVSYIQKNKAIGVDDRPNSVRSQYVAAPYNMNINLYIAAKNQDDGLQILEQILPFFNPDFAVSINDLPEMGIKRVLEIGLDGITYQDVYEGNFTQRTAIVWELSFTLALNFYGPVSQEGVIKTAIAKTYETLDTNADISRKYTVTVNPEDATVVDAWDYVEQFDETYEQPL
jgi:hypothetical protein